MSRHAHEEWGISVFKSLVWISLIDFIVFAWLWFLEADFLVGQHPLLVRVGYVVAAAIGFALAVFGFVMLLRGGKRWLSKSVVCILFTTAPGCAFLVTVLSHVGTRPI